MVYRKGELIKAQINRCWPYQVALRADRCTGAQYDAVHGFCKDISLCPRGHYFWRDDVGFNVFCYSEKKHAEMFCERFGGEMIDVKARKRG
jgi:hypothetical protein